MAPVSLRIGRGLFCLGQAFLNSSPLARESNGESDKFKNRRINKNTFFKKICLSHLPLPHQPQLRIKHWLIY